MTGRVRWQDEGTARNPRWVGRVGTLGPWAFQVWESTAAGWVLESRFPGEPGAVGRDGGSGDYVYGDDPEALKDEAERWLARFAASLGAVFER